MTSDTTPDGDLARDELLHRLHDVRGSRHRFRAIVEHAHDAIYIIHPRDGFRYVNNAFEEITGYTREDVAAEDFSFWDIIHPDDVAMIRRRGASRERGEEVPGRYEFRILSRDAGVRTVEATTMSIDGDDGLVAGILRDITGRVEMERALQESKDLFKELTESATSAVFIYQGDVFKYVNPAMERITGYSESELVGMQFWKVVHPDDMQTVKERARMRLQGMSDQPSRYEVRIVTREGVTRWVDLAVAVITYEGRPAGLGNAYDITGRKQSEQALRESEEKFRLLAERSFDGIFAYDRRGRFTYASPAVKRIAGYEPEEVENRFFGRYILKRDLPQTLKTFVQVRRGKPVRGVRFRIKRKDGEIRTVEVNVVPVVQNGKVTGAQGNIRDVTESEKIQEQLRESEERYETLFEQSNDAIMIIDLTGRIVDVNERYEDTFSRTEEDIVGKRFTELDIDYSVSTREIFKKMERLVLQRDMEDFDITVYDRTIDETYVVHVKANLIKLPEGRFIQVVIRDITDWKRAEQALRESEEKYRDMVENINDVLYTTDMEGTITYISPMIAQLSGYAPGEAIGRMFTDFIHPDDVPRIQERFKQIISGDRDGRPSPEEYRIVLKSGNVKWIRTSSRPVIVDGEMVGLRGVMTDVTDRKQAEHKIAELNDTLRLINKIMRHDILNDLQIAQSSLELYEEEAEPALYDKARQRMRNAVEHIKRMRGLESLVASAKELQPVNLREVADDVVEGCTVDCRVEGNAVVMADDALHSVVQNLVHNAVVHGNADEVTISMRCTDDMCMLRVADNGVGIPGEVKEHVFEEGFSHGGTGGTGLGLYIVKQTVARYGGSVAVEDNEPRGTVFVLRMRRGSHG